MAQHVSRFRPRNHAARTGQDAARAAGLILNFAQSQRLHRRRLPMRTIFTKALRSTFARSILVAATFGATASWGTTATAQTQLPQEMRTQAMSLAEVCKANYNPLSPNIHPDAAPTLASL